jgi:2-keto-4-pentenoate hydratase/2-oxohepta-3-ene-1,7-dioic acid hydratase in catechol pathway
MHLYQTSAGIGRLEAGELAILDVPHPDVATLLGDPGADPARARVLERQPLSDATIRMPMRTGKLILLGANYHSHIKEAGLQVPPRAAGLVIPSLPLNDPFGAIVLPDDAPGQVDYEGEVAVLIGKGGRSIAPGTGWEYIAGLCVANDVSARDVQLAGMEGGRVTDMSLVVKGKAYPTFKPLGPCVVTADEVRHGRGLRLRTLVNGEERQNAQTSDMVFGFAAVVEGVSADIEISPGDIILTGTPAGVGLASRRFLKPGDVVEVEVEGIGAIRNEVVVGEPSAR